MSNEIKTPRVLVRVSGGVVQEVCTEGEVDVYVLDEDNIEAGDSFEATPYATTQYTREEFDDLIKSEVGTNCQECSTRVHPDDKYHGTPCGTFCEEHMVKHMAGCNVCKGQFTD